MTTIKDCIARATTFCKAYNLQVPILLAPMAGACPPSLSVAVAGAGGLGACGASLMQPADIELWATEARTGSNGAFQMNVWIPDPEALPVRDEQAEDAVRTYLGKWGPEVARDAADAPTPDFAAQCEAMLEVGSPIISSIMGVYPPEFVVRMKDKGTKWFATVTTVAEAKEAEAAGADVVVAQGMEAGGHRGAFNADKAASGMVGLFSLLPAVVDAVDVPVVATGGIADARGIAAALLMGASAVQIGTGFLRCPEANLPSAWSNAIGEAQPEDTLATRAFSGRLGRSIATAYARDATSPDAPTPAPYPVQRSLTQAMRGVGTKENDIDRIQAWAGQSARLAPAKPAGEVVVDLWDGAQALLT